MTCAAGIPGEAGVYASCWGTNTFSQLGVEAGEDTQVVMKSEVPVTDVVSRGGFRTVTAGATAVFAAAASSDDGGLAAWGAIVPRETLIAGGLDPDHIVQPNLAHAESAAVLGIDSRGQADTHAASYTVWSTGWWWEDKIPQAVPTPDADDITDLRASVYLGPGAENGTIACGLARGGAVRYCFGGGGRSGGAATAAGKAPLYLASPAVLPAGVLRVVAHDVGATHSCIVGDNGRAYCSGDNAFGQLGAGAAGGSTSAFVEVALPAGVSVPIFAPRAVCTGRAHTCLLSQDGVPHCFGDGAGGKLGNGGSGGGQASLSSAAPLPVMMPGDQQAWAFVELSCGRDYTCALDQQGRAYCWGDNSDGQLGLGAAAVGEPALAPAAVIDAASGAFQQLSTGARHVCGVSRGTGSVFCWGRGVEGQLGLGRNYLTENPSRDLAQPQVLPTFTY